MIGMIEDWLFNKIGVNVNLNNISNNNVFKDGSLIFTLLQKQGLIDVNFRDNITSTSDKLQCLQNLKKFKPLFDMLKVNYDENVVLNIVEGNTTVIYKLLYELYLCFENKQHLNLITSENEDKKEINCSSFDHFKLTTLEPPILDKTLELENPLTENRDVIDWYRHKYNIVKHNMDLRVNRLKEQTLNKVGLKQTTNKCGCVFTDKLSATEQLPDLDTFYIPKVDHDKLLSYAEFIKSYKEKQYNNRRKKLLENDMHHYLLEETWNKVKAKQKERSNSVLSEIILDQSNYEKQILTKLIQAEQQVSLQNEYTSQINRDVCSLEESDIAMKTESEQFKELEELYIEEKKRVEELHKKLYKQKQDQIKKIRYFLCHEIISELLDIAVITSQYKEQYNVPVPKSLWNNWMQMFFKGQTVHIPFQQLEYDDSKYCEFNYDVIIYLEQLEDDVLNKNDIDEYLLTYGKWYFEDVCLERSSLGNNILAYIVYRLLSIKYPPSTNPLPADIPQFIFAGVLNNFDNVEIIDKLNTVLSKTRIHVFNPEIAIKKCIDVYKEKITPTTEKSPGDKSGAPKQKIESEMKGQKDKKKRKSKSKTDQKTTTEQSEGITDEKMFNLSHKETQTSLIVTPKDEKLEQISMEKIGETLLNALTEGEHINDDMMVSVIIQYLKSLEGIEGWILVDFPLNMNQAFKLELAFTGKHLPIENYVSEKMKTDQDIVTNEQSEKIKSKILILPDVNLGIPFKTHFTFFIKGKTKVSVEYEAKQDINENNLLADNSQTMTRNEDEETEEQPLDMLEIFYKDQSIFREFNVEGYDLNKLRKLAETIILEVGELNGLTSTELVGEEFLQTPTTKGKNRKKSKSSLSNQKTAKNKDKKGVKQLPVEPEKETIKNEMKPISTEDQNKLLHPTLAECFQTKVIFPGNEEREYITLPIDNEIGKVLATIWENIEDHYLSNLTDIFFENRTINSRIVPYSKYSIEEIENIRQKTDMRQNLINNFQEYYNSIESDLRTVSQLKCQLHCMVFELQQNLWKITDDIKDDTESRRQYIIKENWLVNELILLINNYLLLIQTEYNKSIETLKLLNYYYLSMRGKNLPTSLHISNEEFNITKLNKDLLLRAQDETMLLTSSESKYKAINDSFSSESEDSKDNFITKSLVDCDEPQNIINILKIFILHESELAKNNLQKVLNYFYNQVQTERNLLVAALKTSIKEKSNYSKVQPSKKAISKKSMNGKSLTEEKSLKEDSSIQLLINEWEIALDCERDNFSNQLNLIEARASVDISEFFCYFRTVFCNLYNSNLKKYNNEISNINKICEFFRTAIEEESSLRHSLIFTNDNFFMKTCENVVNNRSYSIKSLAEDSHSCYFTIHQLQNLKEIFKIVAPNGVIRKQAFSYIFKDLALFNDKDNQPHLPTMWSKLNESQLTGVTDSLCGPEYGVDWRDFIIYNLNITFPTLDEVLLLRKTFLSYDFQKTELVFKEHYENISLWFEDDLPVNPEEGLRLMLVKQLLFELFQVNEQFFNYTALLLYFCKDFDPRNGLRKALSLSIGKHVIINKEELDRILQEETEILETVTGLLSEIVYSIVQDREGVLIFEIQDDTDFPDLEEKVSNSVSLHSESIITSEGLSNQSSIIKSGEQKGTETPVIQNSISFSCPKSEHMPNKWWVSKIPITTIASVLNASFRFESGTHSTVKLCIDILEDEATSDGSIEGYILMSLSCIEKLFVATKKFMISLPCDIIQQHLQANENVTNNAASSSLQ